MGLRLHGLELDVGSAHFGSCESEQTLCHQAQARECRPERIRNAGVVNTVEYIRQHMDRLFTLFRVDEIVGAGARVVSGVNWR